MEYIINTIDNIKTYGATFSEFCKSGDKKIFDYSIDSIICKKYGDDIDTINSINNQDDKNKRLSTLILLSNKNAQWKKIINIIKQHDVWEMKHLKEIIIDLIDFIDFGDVESKKFGEVMTPYDKLAYPMVNMIPKEFWKDPYKKVLDSSAGLGTFLIICAINFMEGLKNYNQNGLDLRDDKTRYKHIVENMLYYGESRDRNVFLWLCIINPFNEFTTNTYYLSTLDKLFDDHIKNIYRVTDGFDLNLQNPPYQIQQEGFKETQPIWHKFVEKAISHTKENGYIVMVHPGGWRNVSGDFKHIKKLLKDRQLIELSIHDDIEGKKMFGYTTSYDYYFLINSKNNNIKTKISNINSQYEIDLSKYDFIPSDNFDLFDKLIANENEEKVNVIHNYSYEHRKPIISKEKNDVFVYPVVYIVHNDESLNLRYSSTNDLGHFGISKIIWCNGKGTGILIDENGEYAMSNFSYAISDTKENLPKIKQAMNTQKFINLMKTCDMSDGNRFNKRVLALFKKDFWKEFI